MSLIEILTIIAILTAPVVAVQVQKWLELFRERQGRKLWVFKTLMATRGAVLSPDHVRALNSIDLEFNEKKSRKVAEAWKVYLDHLGNFPTDNESNAVRAWSEKRIDLLAKLLISMGERLGYHFDEVHVKKGCYSPEAHGRLEDELQLIRKGLVRLLHGETNLKMDVTSFPIGEEEATEQARLRKSLLEIVTSEKPLNIRINSGSE